MRRLKLWLVFLLVQVPCGTVLLTLPANPGVYQPVKHSMLSAVDTSFPAGRCSDAAGPSAGQSDLPANRPANSSEYVNDNYYDIDVVKLQECAQLPSDLPAYSQDLQKNRTRAVHMKVTAYCPCPICCGAYSDGITASGKSINTNGSRFVAADTRILSFGTRLGIPGYNNGQPVPVLDRGGAIKGNRLDVFFISHKQAIKWGVKHLDVKVYEE